MRCGQRARAGTAGKARRGSGRAEKGTEAAETLRGLSDKVRMMSVTRRNTDLRHASCFALAVFCGQCAQAACIDRKKPRVQSLKRARDLCSLLCFSAHAASSQRNLVELLVNLRDMAAIVTVGRYHHDVPFCEGQGHHLALAATAPSVRTPVDASQLSPEPLTDRCLRAPRGR